MLTENQKRILRTTRRGGWISAKKNESGKMLYILFDEDNRRVKRINPQTFTAIAKHLKYKKEGKSVRNEPFVIWIHKNTQIEDLPYAKPKPGGG